MQDLVARKVPDITVKRMMKMKEEAGFGDKSWTEYFDYISRDVMLNEVQSEMIQRNTRDNLLEVWVQNLGHNLPAIWAGKSVADLVPQEVRKADEEGKDSAIVQGSAVVIGRGPSVYKHKHMEALADSGYGGVVVCSDGALKDALRAGVRPDKMQGFYVVSVDGNRDLIWKWYDDPLVDKYGKSIKAVLCSSVAPNVVDRCKEAGVEVYWFHPIFDDWRSNESYTRMQSLTTRKHEIPSLLGGAVKFGESLPSGVPSMQAAGHAGGCAWILAWLILKRSPVALIGIDLGYLPDTPLETTYYWKTLSEQTGGNVGAARTAYETLHNPDFDVDVVVDPVFQHYRRSTLDLLQRVPPWVTTLNCTEGGSLFGEGISGMRFNEFLGKYSK